MRVLGIVEFVLVSFAVVSSSIDPKFFILYVPAVLLEITRDLRCDEMFRYYRFRSSVEALYSMMILISISGFVGLGNVREFFNALLVGTFALKNLLAIFHTMDRENVLKIVGYSISAVLTVFVLLSHGLSLETIIELIFPIAIFSTTFLSLKNRVLGSSLFFSYAIILTALVLKRSRGVGGVAVFLLLIIPLYILGYISLERR